VSSTLTCIKREEGVKTVFDCRLIVDGKKAGEWKVLDIELISEEGKEISVDIEASLTSFIASTDDYFVCETKAEKLTCRGTISPEKIAEEKVEKPAGRTIWEELFGGK